jgi:hypothetical protein
MFLSDPMLIHIAIKQFPEPPKVDRPVKIFQLSTLSHLPHLDSIEKFNLTGFPPEGEWGISLPTPK